MVSEPLTVIFFGAGMKAKPITATKTRLAIRRNFLKFFILFLLLFFLLFCFFHLYMVHGTLKLHLQSQGKHILVDQVAVIIHTRNAVGGI